LAWPEAITFLVKRAAILSDWANATNAAQRAWDALKSDPDHPQHDPARAAIEALRSAGPEYQAARGNLAAATTRADADYQAEMRVLRERHGIVTAVAGR
jgi:hypothetical protein